MINVSIEGLDFEKLKSNAVPAAVTDSLVAAGEKFIKTQLPKRFVAGAARKYGWPARTKKYMLRKAKKKGHQNDLVWSGRLRQTALSGSTVKGSRRFVRATVKIPTPAMANPEAANQKDPHQIRRRGPRPMSPLQQLRKVIAEDYTFIAKLAGSDTVRRLTSDPKYMLKRKPKKKIV